MGLCRAQVVAVVVTAAILFTSSISRAQESKTEALDSSSGALERGDTGAEVPIEVIFTNLPGDPTSDVPGLPGAHFGPGTGTTHFDRVFGSPNGHWAITADTDLATTEDEVLIVDGEVLAREGTPTPWNAGENYGVFDTALGIDSDGVVIFATNTDGPTTADEYLVQVSSGMAAFPVVKEGQNNPFIPGSTWGSTLESPVLSDTGLIGFSADAINGVPTTEDDIVVANGVLKAREGVTIPAGQLGADFWENFDLGDLHVDAAGSSWMVQGDLTGDTTIDDVVVVDGAVVAQEGSILPGSGFVQGVDGSGIVGVFMAPNGRWFVRGNNDTTEHDWVYSNGIVLAVVGNPVFSGSAEVWSDLEFSDCFFLHVGDSFGNFVLGGYTDGPSLTSSVLIVDNTEEIIREGDAFDLDGNGSFDDDTYIDTFGNDDAFLGDDHWLYFVATFKDGTNTRLGQGLFRADLSCKLLPFADGFESGDLRGWCQPTLAPTAGEP